MEKESIIIRINKHNLYRGIRIALSLVVFLCFSYLLWNKREYGFTGNMPLYIAGSGNVLSLAALLGFCFGCFDNYNSNWDRKKFMRGQGYMLAGAVIIQIMMNLILYSMGNAFWLWAQYGAVIFAVYRAVLLLALLGLVFLTFRMRNKKRWLYAFLVQGIGIFYSMLIFYMSVGNIDEYEPFHFIVIPYLASVILSGVVYYIHKRRNMDRKAEV